MNKFTLTALSAGFCLAMSTGAFASTTTMSKGDYNHAKADIAANYKAESAACKPLTANAKDICTVTATGHQKVATAELAARYTPSDKVRYNVRLAKADAAYALANEKCDDAAGNTKDVCRKEATAAYVMAKADAKVAGKTADANATAREKTDTANADARAKTTEARKDAAVEKNDAAYAVAKEKCDAFAGDAKASCIKDAKARFGQLELAPTTQPGESTMTFVNTMTETKDASGAVARTVDQAQSTAHTVIDRASGAARPAVDRVAAAHTKRWTGSQAPRSQTAEAFEAKSGQLLDAHSRMSETCRGYVRDQPFTSLGIAVAAGFLLKLVAESALVHALPSVV